MLWLVLGGLILFVFWGGLRAFERASITSVKSLVAWIAALGGILLGLLLVLTGRWPLAIGALTFFGPTIWNHWRAAHPRMGQGGGSAGPGGTAGQGGRGQGGSGQSGPARRSGAMSREEAYQVLGLHVGATEEEIRAAHHRLMRAAHPDAGGSDWLASRVNQARDVLLR
jgi:DnaJ family protein C protein 19